MDISADGFDSDCDEQDDAPSDKLTVQNLSNNIKINDISNVQAYRIAIFSKSKL